MEGRGTCRGGCTCKICSPISHDCHKRVLLNPGLRLDFQGTVYQSHAFVFIFTCSDSCNLVFQKWNSSITLGLVCHPSKSLIVTQKCLHDLQMPFYANSPFRGFVSPIFWRLCGVSILIRDKCCVVVFNSTELYPQIVETPTLLLTISNSFCTVIQIN